MRFRGSSPPTAKPAHPGLTVLLSSLALFMTALDTLVVNSALPVLHHSLHVSLSTLEWTVNAYNLSFACLLMAGAALGDRFGRRRMFAVGIAVFTAASAAAALSPNVGLLIVARALQGVGAGIVTPLTLTLISEAFPPEKRGAAIGLWGGVAGLAVASGPLVGGAIVDGISWHWIFWLNVPVGILLAPAGLARLRESFGPNSGLDIPGLLLIGAGSFGVAWAMIRSGDVGWGQAEVIATLAAGIALIAAFLAWQGRARTPMMPLRHFRSRGFNSANTVSFFMYAALFGTLFLMSQFFQLALGKSPFDAGLRLLPWTGAPMLVAPLAGILADRIGPKPLMALGMTLQAIGLAWIARVAAPGVGYDEMGIALGIAGVGISCCFPTVAAAITTSVPHEDVGIASGVNSTLRELGGVVGIAVMASVFTRHGVYASPRIFIDGFTAALWVAVGFSLVGAFAATLMPGRRGGTFELAAEAA
jgi:EmrB/QacA subfamily drug resistance transporter